MNSKIKAVIFDLDGLLIDSEPYWDRGDYELFEELGFKDVDSYIPRHEITGQGVRENAAVYIHKLNLNETVESLLQKRWKKLYGYLMGNLRLMPGAREIVDKLNKMSFKLAIATGGHTKIKVNEILGKLDVSEYFEIVVSGLDVKRSKPAPDIYLQTANLLGVRPLNCLVLEDAPNGVLAGKAAKMLVYGVNADNKMRERLKEAGADKVFETLRDINLDT